jgi:hypothetical protein
MRISSFYTHYHHHHQCEEHLYTDVFSFTYNKKKKKIFADNCHVSNEFRVGKKEICSLIKKKEKEEKDTVHFDVTAHVKFVFFSIL